MDHAPNPSIVSENQFGPVFSLFQGTCRSLMNPAGHYSNQDHRIILYNVLIDSSPVSGVVPTCQQTMVFGTEPGGKFVPRHPLKNRENRV